MKANVFICKDVEKEIAKYNGVFSNELKENTLISKKKGLPLCQDTGIVEFFVFFPKNINIDFDFNQALNESVIRTYEKNPFRYSTVKEPLFERKNMKNNSPSIIHYFFHDEKYIEIRFLIKGGGSENLSILNMFNPSVDSNDIKKFIIEHIKNNGVRGCPPLNVGIGIGGTSDKALILSKLALTEEFNFRNPDKNYAQLETELIKELNNLNIGFQALGEGISVYNVHIKEYSTHIATLPLAISIDCYLSRKGRVKIEL